jgi:bifunctional non-homologous end joining protein LigD
VVDRHPDGTAGGPMTVSHPEKVMFPDVGITKGEMVAYYAAAADRMLPHLVNRPLTLQRFPGGIGYSGFMQKHATKGYPDVIHRIELPKQGGTVNYPVIVDEQGLLYLANQNTVTFHIPCFRVSDLEHPDRLVFDLDPSQGDVDGARFGAKAVADFLAELDVPSWVMTSGSKGFHVVIPLDPTIDFLELARFAHGVAYFIALHHPQRLTLEFLKKERKDRVFVDWLRNHFGSTGVSPYSLRPRPGAPIAMPIRWDDLPSTAPDQFTLQNAMERLADDPWDDPQPFDLSDAVGVMDSMLDESGVELPDFDRFGRS